jgi:TPR repeat protein
MRIIAAILLMLSLSAPGAAGPFEDADNNAAALQRLRSLADKGNPEAQNMLGDLYLVVSKNNVEAVTWFRKAAEQGHRLGQLNLGFSYMEGWGVPQDFILAYMWFNLAAAAAQGETTAAQMRDILGKKMTPAQIAEAQKLSHEWKPTK